MATVHTERRATGAIRTERSRLRIEVVFAGFGSPPAVGFPRARPAGTSFAGSRASVPPARRSVVARYRLVADRAAPAALSGVEVVRLACPPADWTLDGVAWHNAWDTRRWPEKRGGSDGRGTGADSPPRIDSPRGRRRRRSDRFGSLLSLSASRLRCEARRATGGRRTCVRRWCSGITGPCHGPNASSNLARRTSLSRCFASGRCACRSHRTSVNGRRDLHPGRRRASGASDRLPPVQIPPVTLFHNSTARSSISAPH